MLFTGLVVEFFLVTSSQSQRYHCDLRLRSPAAAASSLLGLHVLRRVWWIETGILVDLNERKRSQHSFKSHMFLFLHVSFILKPTDFAFPGHVAFHVDGNLVLLVFESECLAQSRLPENQQDQSEFHSDIFQHDLKVSFALEVLGLQRANNIFNTHVRITTRTLNVVSAPESSVPSHEDVRHHAQAAQAFQWRLPSDALPGAVVPDAADVF